MRLIGWIAAMAAMVSPAWANDSSAELAAGGLVLTRNDAVAMLAEDLFISRETVSVAYRFKNTTTKDVTIRVAFPMPDVGDEDFSFHETAIPDREAPANLLAFKTVVDGKPVTAELEQKALVNGADYTGWLKARGVPLAPYLDGTRAALDKMSPEDKARAVALNLAIPEEYDQGQGMETHLSPAWTMKATYHWMQTFPAGREVKIEHSYRPSVGGSAGTGVGSPYASPDDASVYAGRYCIDQAFMAGVRKVMKARGQEYPPFHEERIDYILTTGGNWAGPIGDFRLVIDKGEPDILVSFCADGVRKIGPTQFEVRKTNFKPARDLLILFLKPTPQE